MSELKDILHAWLKEVIRQGVREASEGSVGEAPALPQKFTWRLARMCRQALANGYWLNHVYLQEVRAAHEGRKYTGRVTLADVPEDDELREMLENFIDTGSLGEWQEVIPQEAIDWLEDYIPKLSGGLADSILSKVSEITRNSLLEGSTLQERMKALRESASELAGMSDARIETIARTEITRADSMGRLISMKSNEDVLGMEFSAILDDRTTEMCSERNGLVMRLDDPRLPENTPPLHPRCRSLLLSLTVYDYPDGLLTSHEFDDVPAGMSRAEDIAEIEEILGW